MAGTVVDTVKAFRSQKVLWRRVGFGPKGRYIIAVTLKAATSQKEGTYHHGQIDHYSLDLPSAFSPDPLTEVIQASARELLANAVRAEIVSFLADHLS